MKSILSMKTYLSHGLTLEPDSVPSIGNKTLGTVPSQDNIVDHDLLIFDLEPFSDENLIDLATIKSHIEDRVKSGAVLLCFTDRTYGNSRNYDWLPGFLDQYNFENQESRELQFYGDEKFIEVLNSFADKFYLRCIFKTGSSTPQYKSIGKNKAGHCAALYRQLSSGYVFILPRPDNISEFIETFVSKILPTLDLKFTLSSGSSEPIPESISQLKLVGEDQLKEKIDSQSKRIEDEEEKLKSLQIDLNELERWRELLWQTGEPLEKIVKRFFLLLGLELEKKNVTDLEGEYEGVPVLIEVKGKIKGIDHSSDFRQIMNRKVFDAKDQAETYALLIGNPFRSLPLEERPPEHQDIFSKESIPPAESLGIGLIWTKELFEIVNDVLDSSKNIDRENVLKTILSSKGIYKYKS